MFNCISIIIAYHLDLHQVLRVCFGTVHILSKSGVNVDDDSWAITALNQNFAGTRLITGYKNGRIAIWKLPNLQVNDHDIIKGHIDVHHSCVESVTNYNLFDTKLNDSSGYNVKQSHLLGASGYLLYVIDDAHGMGHGINYCSFTTLPSLAVCLDTGGSVFQLKLKLVYQFYFIFFNKNVLIKLY